MHVIIELTIFRDSSLMIRKKTVEEQLEIIKKYLEHSMPRRENE